MCIIYILNKSYLCAGMYIHRGACMHKCNMRAQLSLSFCACLFLTDARQHSPAAELLVFAPAQIQN